MRPRWFRGRAANGSEDVVVLAVAVEQVAEKIFLLCWFHICVVPRVAMRSKDLLEEDWSRCFAIFRFAKIFARKLVSACHARTLHVILHVHAHLLLRRLLNFVLILSHSHTNRAPLLRFEMIVLYYD